MSLIRVLQTASQTLTHTFFVDEVPTDASGSVTYAFKRLDGTAVASGSGTAGHPGEPGVYTAVLPGQALLDTLTLDWSGTIGGAAVTVRDYVEVVGGFLFGLGELRTRHGLPAAAYRTATLAAVRTEVEQECELICGEPFVPRFSRVALYSDDFPELVLPRMNVRALRAISLDGAAWTTDQVAAVTWRQSGVLPAVGSTWTKGRYVVEFEYGLDWPPEFIRTAAMLRAKTVLSQPKTGVPARAAQFTLADGGVYRLSLPTRETTGIPEVDGAYAKEPSMLRGWLA